MITGHSLGGAVAALCALELSYKNYVIQHFYSFEAPRIFNPELAREFFKYVPHAIRTTHHRDIVPQCATQNWFGYHYHHHPTEVYYPEKIYNDYRTDYKICQTPGDGFEESEECLNSIPIIKLGVWDHTNMVLGE